MSRSQSVTAHWLPCRIDADGLEADVQSRFIQSPTDSISFTGHPILKANLRGRPLLGTKLSLPAPYTAVVVHSDGHQLEDDEPARISAGSKIEEIVLWNLSVEPKASDRIPSALLWLQLANLVHSDNG
ncbi:ribonuclease H2 subunit C [Paragonimus westermani]|uniref:Ribonuclease H2 subunit C n=1 Tax=Paragonimus westermani TaxID=34504 RepID=A0A5J4NUY5_9TREM|nr:ribonuclease H2 subunit C [Paragonimus westermani]